MLFRGRDTRCGDDGDVISAQRLNSHSESGQNKCAVCERLVSEHTQQSRLNKQHQLKQQYQQQQKPNDITVGLRLRLFCIRFAEFGCTSRSFMQIPGIKDHQLLCYFHNKIVNKTGEILHKQPVQKEHYRYMILKVFI